MSERHEHWTINTPDGPVHAEEHVFEASPTCASEGILGYVSMRCWGKVKGCDDLACVCHCHDAESEER